MSINVLFAGPANDWPAYRPALTSALKHAGIDANVMDTADPSEVDYIVFAPNGPIRDFTPYTSCKAVLSLWAGVERIIGNQTLTQPLARMADDGLREGMVEWVTGHVLRYHLGIDTHIHGQDGIWREDSIAPLARTRTVAILGLGALGTACAASLNALNFNVLGWSRTPKTIEGIECFSGEDGLSAVLGLADIVVLLLPDTAATNHLINAKSLALLPKGAYILNPGRGPLIDDDALLDALNSGQVAHATLDVFGIEPLPADHPYWRHLNVTVTPHIASATRPDTASAFVAQNIKRVESGLQLLAEVDRQAGY